MEPQRPIYSDRFTRLLRINALIDTHGARNRFLWWVKMTFFFSFSLVAFLVAIGSVANVAVWLLDDVELALPPLVQAAPRLLLFFLALFGGIFGLAVLLLPIAHRYDERKSHK